MSMPVNHILDTIDTVPIISPIKNETWPERKAKLHNTGAKDPRETTRPSEESNSIYELEFAPNQILHLHQTLFI